MAIVEDLGSGVVQIISSLNKHREFTGAVARRMLDLLEVDAASQTFIVTVLGEFKRGKSTLLNALLAQDLLPHDVTPTTAAICVLRYSNERSLVVHWADGREETRELSKDSLESFTAEADFDPERLDYLEIGLPSDLLQGGLVIVDTPGVNDLNHHRSEVAARFVPRSDAVVFVLSAAAPVRRTELEFLDTKILEAGLERILFVANFADLIDQSELADLQERVARRLAPALRGHEPKVVPFSATLGLRSAKSKDRDMAKASGLTQLQLALSDLAKISDRTAVKQRRLLHRCRLCLLAALTDIEQGLALTQKDLGELTKELETVVAALSNKAERSARLGVWIDDRQAEIMSMVRKSLAHMRSRLTEEVLEQVDTHKSGDFKEFVEERIPRMIKNSCRNWVEMHTTSVVALVTQLDQRVSSALGEEFATYIPRLRPEGALSLGQVEIHRTRADDVSNATLHASLMTGGVAALAVAMHAMVFVPIVGIVAVPFVAKYYMDHKLAAAKERARPELADAVERALSTFSDGVIAAVDSEILAVRWAAETRFDELMMDLRNRITDEIEVRRHQKETEEQRLSKGEAALVDLKQNLKEIEGLLASPGG